MEATDEAAKVQFRNGERYFPITDYKPEKASVDTKRKTEDRKPQCIICRDVEDDSIKLLYPCKSCTTAFCEDCLRKWYLDATKDESRMIPKCCAPFNVGLARTMLPEEEAQLFREKLEEHKTFDRVYCPLPDCAAFMPKRLFPEKKKSLEKDTNSEAQEHNEASGIDNIMAKTGVEQDTNSGPGTPRTSNEATSAIGALEIGSRSTDPVEVACPKCTIGVCSECKQVSHAGTPCIPDEPDIELEEMLKKYKIKRCPKCHAGVRRMYGCNGMSCRCGYLWCWMCLQSLRICGEIGCRDENGAFYHSDDDDTEDDDDDEAPDDEDFDSGGGLRWEHEGLNFGEEPDVGRKEVGECEHEWKEGAGTVTTVLWSHLDCDMCEKAIHRPVKDDDGQLIFSATPGADDVKTLQEHLKIYVCQSCNLLACGQCFLKEKE